MQDVVITKSCCQCKEHKPLTINFFHKNKTTSDGFQPICKGCRKNNYNKVKQTYKYKQKSLSYRNSRKQEKAQYDKKYRKENKAKIDKRTRKWIKDNSERYIKNKQDYYKQNKHKILKQRQENKEHNRKVFKIWNNKNKEHRKKYRRNRYLTDLNFRLVTNLRSRISLAVKGTTKSAKTMELLGCSIEFVKQHLESTFADGMSWDNYGYGDDKWHIDHIKPCASFDLSDPEQQKECFNYKNLQALWQSDNFTKSDKF